MKPTGYWPCRNEIINAHLSAPHKYEPFTELFDTEKLGEIRSKYGADLYKECYTDALYEVVEAANVTAPRINEIATKAGLCVLFQCPTH